MPQNEDEIVLLTTTSQKNILDKYVLLNGKYFKVVGICVDASINTYRDVQLFTGSKKFEKEFRKRYFQTHLNIYKDSKFLTIKIDDNQTTKIVVEDNNLFVDYDLIYSKYLLIDHTKLPRIVTNGNDPEYAPQTNYFIIGSDFLDLIDENIYEASVYGDKYVLNRRISSNNLNAYDPQDSADETIPIARFFFNFITYVIIFFATGAMVLIYFITYMIISRVYASKKAGYAIFRTLGVTKKDMNKVVRYEIMSQVIFSAIFVYFLFFILGKTVNNSFFNMFKHISPFITIWYFLVILVLGLLLAKRFNRKLFSFTVKSTLKAGE